MDVPVMRRPTLLRNEAVAAEVAVSDLLKICPPDRDACSTAIPIELAASFLPTCLTAEAACPAVAVADLSSVRYFASTAVEPAAAALVRATERMRLATPEQA